MLGLIVTSTLLAGDGGKTGFAFLRIGTDARASSMGEAMVASANEASAAFWNPALLVLSDKSSISLSTGRWIEDVRHHVGAIKLGNDRAAWGLNVVFTGVDGIQVREIPSAEPTAVIASHDVAIGSSYARRLNDQWAVGAGVRYIYERIISSVHAVGFDAGAHYDTHLGGEVERLTFGASLTHVGFSGKFVNETVPLPATFRFGARYRFTTSESDYAYVLAMDGVKLFKGDVYEHSGAEISYRQTFFVRAGYQFGYEARSWTSGLGIRLKDQLTIDYAFVPLSHSLGSTHRVTIGLAF